MKELSQEPTEVRFPEPVKIAFLDRDGTLNVERNYPHRVADFEWIPGALEALRLFNRLGFYVAVVTNQSGIARGYYGRHEVNELHQFMATDAANQGARIDTFVYCPHHPDGVVEEFRRVCECRKPATGMLQQVVRELNWDRQQSFLAGDARSDIECGRRFGIQCYLVRTGYGRSCEHELDAPAFDDILDLARSIEAGRRGGRA